MGPVVPAPKEFPATAAEIDFEAVTTVLEIFHGL